MSSLDRVIEVIFKLKKLGAIKKQDDIAEKTGYNKSSISEILNGKVPLSDKFIQIFAAKYNVNEIWIYTGEGEVFNNSKPSEPDENPKSSDELVKTLEILLKMKDETIKMKDSEIGLRDKTIATLQEIIKKRGLKSN